MKHDDPDSYEVPETPSLPAAPRAIIELLGPLVTDRRRQRLTHSVEGRTHHLCLILDQVHDPHNTSAIMRSADAFGIQRIYIIQPPGGFRAAHQVSKGTHRWLDIRRFDDVESCVKEVRSRGYRILCADMQGDETPASIAAGDPVAIVFGNEHSGVSPTMRELADGTYEIPMRGFVESLNVSVAAAITMHAATASGTTGLTGEAQDTLLARWLMEDISESERIIQERLLNKGDSSE